MEGGKAEVGQDSGEELSPGKVPHPGEGVLPYCMEQYCMEAMFNLNSRASY